MDFLRYIDDDIQNGIEYDWELVYREFCKLKIPSNVYNPFNHHNIESGKYFVDIALRSNGKTTNWLLLGMVLNKLYNTQIVYIRQILDMIMPKNMELFNAILENGYIEKVTEGQYNSIKYSHRRYYYFNTETNEIAADALCVCLSIDQAVQYKSSMNLPRGDIAIFDEFISRYSSSDEFVAFMDLLKTIFRERISPIVVMLGNTVELHNIYFKELEIYDQIRRMKTNQSKEITIEGGSIISINVMSGIASEMSKKRKRQNKLFFAFKNKKLNSIRGGDWAIDNYPHMPHFEEDDQPEEIINNWYVSHNGLYLKLDLLYHDDYGYFIHCHPATRVHDDASIYSLSSVTKYNEIYGIGNNKYDQMPWKMRQERKWFYASNYDGTIIDSYINELQKSK